eukprot:SAG11_NODE_46_length_20454_cov_11.499386_12_plen_43_part_00
MRPSVSSLVARSDLGVAEEKLEARGGRGFSLDSADQEDENTM